MAQGDSLCELPRQSGVADLVVIGGGIMGLWAALHGCRRGLSVTLVERDTIGAGASGGLLGALMPHMPDRWSAKKQLQFDALLSLEDEIAALEDETGLSACYRRAGRLIPLPKPHLAEIARGHEQDALSAWKTADRRFFWHCQPPAHRADLIDPQASAFGLVEDTFAARVSPRAYTALLKAALARHRNFRLLTGQTVTAVDAAEQFLALEDGTRLPFGQLVIAAGTGSEPLLEALCGPLAKPVVMQVKGQAAMLEATLPKETPVIYLDGLYIVPHEGNRVAIGSTSENRFDDPLSTDGQLEALISAARELVPRLREAKVVERWAGLRPKAIGRDPMVGRLPAHPHVLVLTGGFKTSFGLAHLLADRLIAHLLQAGSKLDLPDNFYPESHLLAAGVRLSR